MSGAGGRSRSSANAATGAATGARSSPGAVARADTLADLADAIPAGAPPDEMLSDQRLLDGWDDHLDDDRMFDPPNWDPVDRQASDAPGNRGRTVLELLVIDGQVSSRVLDSLGAGSEPTVQKAAAGRLRLLGALGRVLAAVNEEAVLAPTEELGLRLINPVSGIDIERHPAVGDVGFERSFVSRSQTDLVRMPWGTVPIQWLITGKKGAISPTTVRQAWTAFVLHRRRHEAEHGPTWPRGAVERTNEAISDATGLDPNACKKYTVAFRTLSEHADLVWGLAGSAIDAGQLQVALEARGVVLKESVRFLYQWVQYGQLLHPDDVRNP